jgi:hypothetical protein
MGATCEVAFVFPGGRRVLIASGDHRGPMNAIGGQAGETPAGMPSATLPTCATSSRQRARIGAPGARRAVPAEWLRARRWSPLCVAPG